MTRTSRLRRIGTGVALVVAPLLILIGQAIGPWNSGDDTTVESLQQYAENTSAFHASNLLMFLGILASVPAIFGIVRFASNRTPMLALIGGAVAIAGVVAGMITVVADQFHISLAQATAARDSIASALDDYTPWVLVVVLAVFLLGSLVGTVLLGVALMRERTLPVWIGAALLTSQVVGLLAHAAFDEKGVALIGVALWLASGAALAVRVFAASDQQWESGEIATAPANPAIAH